MFSAGFESGSHVIHACSQTCRLPSGWDFEAKVKISRCNTFSAGLYGLEGTAYETTQPPCCQIAHGETEKKNSQRQKKDCALVCCKGGQRNIHAQNRPPGPVGTI